MRTKNAVSGNLSRFKQLCLDPLPDAVLIDTEFNSLLRDARGRAWCKASAATDLAKAELGLLRARSNYEWWMSGREKDTALHEKDHEALARYRRAIASQLLVPAARKEHVAWKRRAASDEHLPIDPLEVEKAIATDEAWLSAHPTRRKAVRS